MVSSKLLKYNGATTRSLAKDSSECQNSRVALQCKRILNEWMNEWMACYNRPLLAELNLSSKTKSSLTYLLRPLQLRRLSFDLAHTVTKFFEYLSPFDPSALLMHLCGPICLIWKKPFFWKKTKAFILFHWYWCLDCHWRPSQRATIQAFPYLLPFPHSLTSPSLPSPTSSHLSIIQPIPTQFHFNDLVFNENVGII